MRLFRRIAPALLLLAALGLGLRALIAMSAQGGVIGTRALAVAFLICDVGINALLIILLVIGEPRAQAPDEWQWPRGAAWAWYLLLGVAALFYLGLAPLFLFLYLKMQG